MCSITIALAAVALYVALEDLYIGIKKMRRKNKLNQRHNDITEIY